MTDGVLAVCGKDVVLIISHVVSSTNVVLRKFVITVSLRVERGFISLKFFSLLQSDSLLLSHGPAEYFLSSVMSYLMSLFQTCAHSVTLVPDPQAL